MANLWVARPGEKVEQSRSIEPHIPDPPKQYVDSELASAKSHQTLKP